MFTLETESTNSLITFLAKGIFSFIKSTVSSAFPAKSNVVESTLLTWGSLSSALFKTSKILSATVTPSSNILFIGFTIFESKLFNIFEDILLISLLIVSIPFNLSKLGFSPLDNWFLTLSSPLIVVFKLELILFSWLIILWSELLGVNLLNLVKNSLKVCDVVYKLESLLDKLSINSGVFSYPLFIAFIKSFTPVEADDDTLFNICKSFFIIGVISLILDFVSFKNDFTSLDKEIEFFKVVCILGISFCNCLTISDIWVLASEAKLTVVSIFLNLLWTWRNVFSTFTNLGNSFSRLTPMSLSVSNTTVLTVFITVWFIWSWIVEAPLSVILGAIAFIFSLTVYIMSAFLTSLLTKDVKLFEKLGGISIVA